MQREEFITTAIQIAKSRIGELQKFEGITYEQIQEIQCCKHRFNTRCGKENLELAKTILMMYGGEGRLQ